MREDVAGPEHPLVDTTLPPLDQLVDERQLGRVMGRGDLVEWYGHR